MIGWIMGIIIFLVVVYLLSWLFTTSTSLSKYAAGSTPLTISRHSINDPKAANYGYSLWVYIDDWSVNYGARKILFERDQANPRVSLGDQDNDLITDIKLADSTFATCRVPNIPLQKWTNIIVTLNDKSLDTYINGKLVKTCVLKTVATQVANGDVRLTSNGGFSGFTARFNYWGSPISPQQAWNIYTSGPGGNILSNFFNQYKLQLSFLKGTETKASITI